jgi:hypothetical protein
MKTKRVLGVVSGLAMVVLAVGAVAAPIAMTVASDPPPPHGPNGNPVDGGPAHLGALSDPDDGGQVTVRLIAFGDPDDGGQIHLAFA